MAHLKQFGCIDEIFCNCPSLQEAGLVEIDQVRDLTLQFCKQIGRNASTVTAPTFLGMSTMYDLFTRSS